VIELDDVLGAEHVAVAKTSITGIVSFLTSSAQL